ncbi:4-hydroxy-tetrahydrodipicolinate reductase [Lysobacteraceae bacterium NML07-0707]|nr:4-hydroxy-tetrahydrodipicolinate reductase [Xanthomonadaceae bacterium NML07-0707]
MAEALRLLIHGASGRMGQALLRLVAEDERFAAPLAVSRRQPLERVSQGAAYFAASELDAVPAFDVLLDFSLPEGFDAALALVRERGKPLVSGTTGLSGAQQAALREAAGEIPVLWASNFSIGVALLQQLVRKAASALPGWDCDIIEMHHTQKQDAPSGTALSLGAAAEKGGAAPHYAAIRAGDIVGEHWVQFAGTGERIELVHRATNRDIFARGALQAALWLAEKPAGCYALSDLLSLR